MASRINAAATTGSAHWALARCGGPARVFLAARVIAWNGAALVLALRGVIAVITKTARGTADARKGECTLAHVNLYLKLLAANDSPCDET